MLHICAQRGFTDVAKMLLLKGASVDVLDTDRYTPLVEAAGAGHKDMCEVHTQSIKGVCIDDGI